MSIDYKADRVQFARLIDEMMAALDGSVVTKMINDMAVSMDLSIGEVNKMLDFAVNVWECAKVDVIRGINVPGAACPRCGGWTSSGGMSQYRNSTTPVHGRTGCTCHGLKISKD